MTELNRILIVDDGATSRVVLIGVLQQHGECVTTDNGLDGVKLYEEALEKNQPFHLVFLDLILPKMDGHEVLKTIRTLEKQYKLPVEKLAKIIISTASYEKKDLDRALAGKCNHYLLKPLQEEKIQKALRQLKLI